MSPVTEKYIETKYIRNNKDVEITYSLRKEIEQKANYILRLAKLGKKVTFTDIEYITRMLNEDNKNNI